MMSFTCKKPKLDVMKWKISLVHFQMSTVKHLPLFNNKALLEAKQIVQDTSVEFSNLKDQT